MGAAHPVEPAVEIEGPFGGPRPLHQVQIFLRPLIALGLRREVAVAFLLGVGLAGDDVERKTAAGQLIEGRDLAGKQGGRDEAWPVSDKICHPLGPRRRVHCHEEALRRRRRIADEYHVETRRLVGLGKLHNERRRNLTLDDEQGRFLLRWGYTDHADDAGGHGCLQMRCKDMLRRVTVPTRRSRSRSRKATR